MKKQILFLTMAIIASVIIGKYVWAADSLGTGPGQFSDATKYIGGSRWSLGRVATTTTSLTSVTNVVLSTPGIVGQVIYVPASAADVFEVHTASAITGATAANEIFVSSTNTTPGVPIFFNFHNSSGGLDATNGIVTVFKPGITTLVSRAFLEFDKNR